MIIIVFFVLLWPGKYTDVASNIPLFGFMDVQLSIGAHYLDIVMCYLAELLQAQFASLTFTDHL